MYGLNLTLAYIIFTPQPKFGMKKRHAYERLLGDSEGISECSLRTSFSVEPLCHSLNNIHIYIQ